MIQWISTKYNLPPINKVVLCYFVTQETSLTGTPIEVVELKFGAINEKLNRYKRDSLMGGGIRGLGSFSASNVKYWADIQPPDYNENWLKELNERRGDV